MKKIIILMCIVLATACTGCGNKEAASNTEYKTAWEEYMENLKHEVNENCRRQDENFVTETVITEQILVENIEVEHTWEEATTYWDDIEG